MLAAGLFGKVPAHGDFVWRGWSDGLVARLDHWLTQGLSSLRGALGEGAYAETMANAPLWHCWLTGPAGECLHGVITPTVDSAGRMFMLVAGVSGPAADVWAVASQHPAFAATAEAAAYDALAGGLDADGLASRLAEAVPAVDGVGRFLASLSCPASSAFWVPNPAAGPPVALPAEALDAGTLDHLVRGATAHAA
ncbi:type VI secretion system-associated protein TagF [Sandarakinorhabdus oryzae]|uniref:type VI secretion system-associated protein TagF n=1 Tax=Sandarakinorhabdus oryzae TaxID=2675220 RepID=UPI0018CC0651|nr:type VI secretion system-associated protein TagF [Sandarakinorhabdus oryzae]